MQEFQEDLAKNRENCESVNNLDFNIQNYNLDSKNKKIPGKIEYKYRRVVCGKETHHIIKNTRSKITTKQTIREIANLRNAGELKKNICLQYKISMVTLNKYIKIYNDGSLEENDLYPNSLDDLTPRRYKKKSVK